MLKRWFRRKDDCTYEGLMDELAKWVRSDVCELEGCDNSMLEYNSHAFYCSPACRAKGWRKENNDWTKEYDQARNQEPDRRAKLYEYQARYLAKRELENG